MQNKYKTIKFQIKAVDLIQYLTTAPLFAKERAKIDTIKLNALLVVILDVNAWKAI